MAPHDFFYWNVHLDGLEYTHDLIVEREGVFKEAVLAMRMAKILGYQVATNTTIYKETDMDEIEQMLDFLGDLGVDGHTISPGYEYDAAKQDMIKRLNLRGDDFFLTREGTREKFKDLHDWTARYPVLGTPIYHEFLTGERELTCSAWAIPTRNIAGWRAPCYFMAGAGHYPTYAQMLSDVDWTKYGVDQDTGAPRDPRCENCMTQCGFEPTAAIGLDAKPGDTWKNIKFNFGPRPKPTGRGSLVDAYNGVTSGRGHLTGAEARTAQVGCGSGEPVAA
jgi:hopanoid biosynthesis associated radical SAM protein HpnH